jgi:hypothetical protein
MLSFSAAAVVDLVQFDLTFQSSGFEYREMKQRLPQPLVDARDDFHVPPEVLAQPVSRHELIEPLEDRDLTLQPREALAAPAATALEVATSGAIHLERSAENTLVAVQKVGRTTEMGLFPRNHRDLPYSLGYETP